MSVRPSLLILRLLPDISSIVFACNAASRSQLDEIPNKITEIMTRIRPHAVRLVDSWSIPDYLLDRYVSCDRR